LLGLLRQSLPEEWESNGQDPILGRERTSAPQVALEQLAAHTAVNKEKRVLVGV
jgi:hypothetical protein